MDWPSHAAVTFLPQGSGETEQASGATAGDGRPAMSRTRAGSVGGQKGRWKAERVDLTRGHLGPKKYRFPPGLSLQRRLRSCVPHHTWQGLGFLGFFLLSKKTMYRPSQGGLPCKPKMLVNLTTFLPVLLAA